MTTLDLNGRTVSVQSPDDTPLLWAIRDEFAANGMDRSTGSAMRLLPVRPDHAGGFSPEGLSESDRRRHQRSDGRQSVSLHDLRAHP